MLKRGPDPFMIAKLLIGIATLNYAIAPLFADLNSTHGFHAEWRARSKLPMVWLFRAKFHYRCCIVVDMAKRPGVAGRHSGLVCGGDSGSPPAPKVCTAGCLPTQAVETGFDESSFPGQK